MSYTTSISGNDIWTYSAANEDDSVCPCAPTPGDNPPTFIKNNYYCEGGTNKFIQSTFYLSDALWDGHSCPSNSGCCAELGMPWFYRRTPVPLSENIEVRICKDEVFTNEDTAIEEMDIYVL